MHPQESVGCFGVVMWTLSEAQCSPSVKFRRDEDWNCNAGKVTANLLGEKEPIQLVLFS